MQQQRQPATGAGRQPLPHWLGGANGWGLFRIDPSSGNLLWTYSPFPSNGMSAPSVGPDGSVYFSRSLSYLESVTPAGQSRWRFFDGSIIDHPAVSPDGSVVVAGVRPNFGQPGSVRAWNAGTGTVAWQIDLPNENGGNQILYTQPRFSADSKTAYFGTAILGGGDELSFLYAVRQGHQPAATLVAVRGARRHRIDTRCRPDGDRRCGLLGRNRGTRSRQAARRIVVAQRPASGTRLPLGGRVHLTVGRR